MNRHRFPRGALSRSLSKAIVTAICILAGGLLVQRTPTHHALPASTANTPSYDAVISGVGDGDSLTVMWNGNEERLRLIGIDAAERSDNPRAAKQAERSHHSLSEILKAGEAAAHHMRSLVHPGDNVRLEFDQEQRDQYGRLLAYVYLPNGEMLNKRVLMDGFAKTLVVAPNFRFRKEFAQAVADAKLHRRGMWAELDTEQ